MQKRKIVQIDESKCDGCGQCVPNCHEGALQIIDGKARLVKDQYCDGLGACLGHCPQDAIRIIEREAESFSEDEVKKNLSQRPVAGTPDALIHAAHGHAGCPSVRAMSLTQTLRPAVPPVGSPESVSQLRNWPLELSLVPVNAPYLNGADLLIAADCVGFTMPDFHSRFLQGRILVIACPKLDDSAMHAEKLAAMFGAASIASVTVVHMEVPCCFGLRMMVEEAIEKSGKTIPFKDVTVSIQGQVKDKV